LSYILYTASIALLLTLIFPNHEWSSKPPKL